MLRILLVDDHLIFRRGVAAILTSGKAAGQLELLGEAADGQEAVDQARRLKPDVVLMDIHMPKMDGIEAARLIKAENPKTRVVMLTVSDDDHDLFSAIKAGADGYLLKNLSSSELLEAIQSIKAGEAAISGGLAARILKEMARPGTAAAQAKTAPREKEVLTDRELEVLHMASRGMTNKEIAAALTIAENTVKNHMRNVLEKLHFQNRTQAVAYALREGLVDPEDNS